MGLAVMLIAPIWDTAAATILYVTVYRLSICLGLIREYNHSTKYLLGKNRKCLQISFKYYSNQSISGTIPHHTEESVSVCLQYVCV